MKNNKGQALVALLFFVLVGLSVAISSIFILISNSISTTQTQVYEELKIAAQSGIEQSLVKLLKNPEYTGETFLIGENSVSVSVLGESVKVITSTAVFDNLTHTIEASVGYNDYRMVLLSWKEK